jgi:hypothetical protein
MLKLKLSPITLWRWMWIAEMVSLDSDLVSKRVQGVLLLGISQKFL